MSRCAFYFCLLLMLFGWSQVATARGDYQLVINQSEKLLIIKKQDVTLRSFHVALGSGGRHGKQQAGDRKTPIGQYHIIKVRSSDRFHLFMQLDYPSVRDAMRALKKDLISKMQYQAILDAHIYHKLPPQDTNLGGSIGIHGIGHETQDKLEIHQMADWTQGCIALRNDEIEQLKQYIDIGTVVTIIE